MTKEPPTSFRLSQEAARLLEKLSERWGISKTAVIEMVIRNAARQELDKEKES